MNKGSFRGFITGLSPQKTERAATALLCTLCVYLVLAPLRVGGFCLDELYGRGFMFMLIGDVGIILGLAMLLREYFSGEERLRLRGLLPREGLPMFLLAMLLWSCLSCALSTDPELSLRGTWVREEGLFSYFSYAGVYLLAARLRQEKHIRLIRELLVAAAVLMALLPAADMFGLSLGCTRREGFFYNSNHFGYYLAIALPTAAGLFMCDKRLTVCLLHGAELAATAFALIGSMALGAFLAVCLSLIALAVLTFFVDRRRIGRALIVIAVFAAVTLVSAPGYWNIGGDLSTTADDTKLMSEAISGVEVDETKLNRIGSGRGKLWAGALRFVRERPLFGYGPDNLGARYLQENCRLDRPHCEPLQFAASLGIPAMLFYLAGMLCLLLLFIKHFRHLGIYELCAYCVVGSYLASSLVGNTMFYTSPFFFLSLGLCQGRMKRLTSGRI